MLVMTRVIYPTVSMQQGHIPFADTPWSSNIKVVLEGEPEENLEECKS